MSIRQRAVRGGAVLVVRQAIGMLLSVCGLFMITRLVGPHAYGLYAASAGLVTYLSNFGPWGIDVFLLRDKQEPTKEHYEVAISLLLLISVTLSATVALASPWITAFMHLPAAGPMLATLCLGLVPAILSVAASAKLGRELEFKKIAFNELSGQAAFLLVALPLAFKGLKAWAPVAGWVAQQWTLLVASYLTSKLRCGLGWNTKLAKYMLSSGLTYSSSVWVWQLRSLINPLIVGRLAGAEAV